MKGMPLTDVIVFSSEAMKRAWSALSTTQGPAMRKKSVERSKSNPGMLWLKVTWRRSGPPYAEASGVRMLRSRT